MALNKLLIFSFIVFLTGAVLTALIIDQHQKIPTECISQSVQTGFNLLLMLSVTMTVVPFIQLFCHWGCNCPQIDLWYKWIVVGILIVLIIGTSMVIEGLNSNKTTCNISSVKSSMIAILSTTVIVLIMIIIMPYIIKQ